MLAHGAAQLRREREDDVEVRNGQEQVALALHPLAGGSVAHNLATSGGQKSVLNPTQQNARLPGAPVEKGIHPRLQAA
jgi:hypothetical protein